MKFLKLLVVDDSPGDVRLIREALRDSASAPVDITVATDGVEAMEHLRQTTDLPDLVLLDLNLPRKNGREVLEEIKSSPELLRIPVVIMTSSKAEQDIADAYRLNANCYVVKPNELRDYVKVVRAVEDFWFFSVTLPSASQTFTTQSKPHSAARPF